MKSKVPGRDVAGEVQSGIPGLSNRLRKETAARENPGQVAGESAPCGEQTRQSCQPCAECLGAVAHRLSQPLTALRGTMELTLLTEGSAAEYHAALEQSLSLAENLVQLIVSLRELAGSAAPSGPPTRVPLGLLGKAAGEELRALAESRGIQVVFESTNEVYVRANLERLPEAILRVLHWTIQRSPEGGTIRLDVSKSDRNACLTICDSRRGSQPSEFDQGRRPINFGCLFAEATKGSCLEWVIARLLVEAEGGSLQAESRVSQGCCSRLCLPATDDRSV